MKLNSKIYIFKIFSLIYFISPIKNVVNLKIVPSHQFVLQKQEIDTLKKEIEHDINQEINKLEENWGSKERMRERSSSVWNLHGAPIFLPKQYSTYSTEQLLKNKENSSGTEKEGSNADDDLSKKLESQLETTNEMVNQLKNIDKDIQKGIE